MFLFYKARPGGVVIRHLACLPVSNPSLPDVGLSRSRSRLSRSEPDSPRSPVKTIIP